MSYISDKALDETLKYIQNNVKRALLVKALSSDYATVTASGNILGAVNMSSSDFAIANGDTSGRKITISEKKSVSITADGTVDGVVWVDDTNQDVVVYDNSTASVTVLNGDTVDVQSQKIELSDAN